MSSEAHSLYVHIPFCSAKCGYCDFYSVSHGTFHADLQEAVVREIMSQRRFFFEELSIQDPAPLRSIYVGGGTPSALPRPLLRRLFASLGGEGRAGRMEWTVEANPESLDEEFLEECSRAGVTRLSVGIQSMRDDSLRLLGRSCTRRDIDKALALLGREWRGDLSVDLLTGVPGQSVDEVVEGVSLAGSPGISHVSLYNLTVEPSTPLHAQVTEGAVKPNSQEYDDDLWFAGCEALERLGFLHYEVSNFSLPGKECKHNLGYWYLLPYIGVGPSAVSTIPPAGMKQAVARMREELGSACAIRVSNPRSLTGFLKGRENLWSIEVEAIEPRDLLLETLMMGLRLSKGIHADLLEARFGRSFDELFPGLWKKWADGGNATLSAGRLQLSRKGRLLLNTLLREVAERSLSEDLPPLRVRWPDGTPQEY